MIGGKSVEKNDSFNIAFTLAKSKLVLLKQFLSLKLKLVLTDLILFINDTWFKSFTKIISNKIAVAKEG